jgi:hypothetical protein
MNYFNTVYACATLLGFLGKTETNDLVSLLKDGGTVATIMAMAFFCQILLKAIAQLNERK